MHQITKTHPVLMDTVLMGQIPISVSVLMVLLEQTVIKQVYKPYHFSTFYLNIITIMLFHYTVTVTSPPVFVTQPSEEAVLLGDRANFSCIVTGEPQPSITWRKDGTILTDEKTPYLIIASVETGNRGFYSCEASNSEGTITSGEALLRITS